MQTARWCYVDRPCRARLCRPRPCRPRRARLCHPRPCRRRPRAVVKPYLCGMQIIPLSEGAFTIDKTKRFVPFDTDHDDLQQRPAGSLLVEVQPFAIVTSEDILLIDTGLGFEIEGHLQIHSNLIKAGIDPAGVTKVLMSHLHKDHAGGIAWSPTSDNAAPAAGPGAATLSFPNATYYVQRQELAYAFEKGPSS